MFGAVIFNFIDNSYNVSVLTQQIPKLSLYFTKSGPVARFLFPAASH